MFLGDAQVLGALSRGTTILPRLKGTADERLSRTGQRLTQPFAVYAPVLALLPLDPAAGVEVTVVGAIAFRATLVELVV